MRDDEWTLTERNATPAIEGQKGERRACEVAVLWHVAAGDTEQRLVVVSQCRNIPTLFSASLVALCLDVQSQGSFECEQSLEEQGWMKRWY